MAISDEFPSGAMLHYGELSAAVVSERKRLGWKQFALAYEAGVTERTIQRLERGEKVNDETVSKVMKALRLSLQQPSRSRRRRSGRDHAWYSSAAKAARGLYGKPLGFGQFLRSLPDDVLQMAISDEPLLLLITLHAMLIVDGDPNHGIDEERVTDQAVHRIRMQLIAEHLRRIAFLRVRSPRDPFTEIPEIAWWKGHPFVELLYTLPLEARDKFKGIIMRTGDLTVLMGHMLARPDGEIEDFLQRVEKIDSNIAEILEWVEAEYGDSQKLAWSEPMPPISSAGADGITDSQAR
jgi:transcriptional regulator with XRE-family HTH domain